jgi:WD40 repeat protein
MGLSGKTGSWKRFAAGALLGIALAGAAAPVANGAGDGDSKAIPLKAIDHPGKVDFQQEVLPLLRDNCLACHNSTRAKADLVLETPATILKGGENGPAVVPGNAKASLLLQAAAHQADPAMPPKDNKVRAADLSGQQLSLIQLWIDQGATGEVRATVSINWVPPAAEVRPIYAVALTPDGRYAAVGRANHLDLYDVSLGKYAGSLADPGLIRSGIYGPAGAAHRGMVESLAFNPVGDRLASGGFAEVKIWRRQAPAEPFSLSGPASKADVPIVATAAGGNWVAIARAGAPIDLFDAMTGKWAKSIDASTSAARAIAFSPDATKLAVASADGGLRISTIAEGELLAQTATPTAVNALAWVAGGAELAAAGPDGVIRIYTLPQHPGEPFGVSRELKGHGGAVNAFAAAGAGPEFYSGGADGTIRCWNVVSGQAVRQFSQGGPVAELAARSDGKVVASCGPGTHARLWDAEKAAPIAELVGGIAARREVARRDRMEKIASGDVAYFTSLVEKTQSGKKAADDRLKAASDARAAADAKAAEARTARDKAESAKLEAEKPATTMPTTAPAEPKAKQKAEDAAKALAQAETQLAALSLVQNNAVNEFNLATAAVARANEELAAAKTSVSAAQERHKAADEAVGAAKRDLSERPMTHLAFSADGSLLAGDSGDGMIDLFAADKGAAIQTVRAPRPEVISLLFAGQKVLVATRRESQLLSPDGSWTLERTIGSAEGASPLPDRVTAVAFSPDGSLLATGSGEPSRSGQIKLWDAVTGQLVREISQPHSDTVQALEFSPDGKLLASGAADRFAKIFDVENGKLVKAFEGHSDQVSGVSWKADGRTLATSSADNQVKFWDVPSGERKSNAAGFGKEVDAVRYIGLGDQAIAAGGDGQIRILNEAGATVKAIGGASDFFHAAAITPDGSLLAVGGESGVLFLWREPFTSPPMTFAPPSPR